MDYTFGYLLGDTALFLVWLILFLWRKDVRKEMLFLSIVFGILGLILGFVYTIDWWHPLTLTHTIIGIEDFILGFVAGGVGGVIYEEIFKKKLKPRNFKKNKSGLSFIPIILIGLVFFYFFFYFLKISSFYASLLGLFILTIFILIKRKDLIQDSLVSGFLLAIVSLIFYIIPELLMPGWIASSWYFENLSGITFLKVPIEDILWFFFSGCFIGPLYEFWKEDGLIKK